MKTMAHLNSVLRAALWITPLLLTLAACEGKRENTAATASSPAAADATSVDANVFKVLATSDLRDAQPLEAMVEKATGVRLRFTFGGTMESVESVLSGKTDAQAAWFANAKYLLSDPKGQARVKLQEKIALSPLTVGVSESVATKLGWVDEKAKVTWKTVTQAAKDGQLRYAMSNPATSNQGFMALMGVVAAAGGQSEVLTAADVDRNAISAFIKGYALPGDNSSTTKAGC
jgi:Ca-activated chloride channel homolog